jgi:hypothetical protein
MRYGIKSDKDNLFPVDGLGGQSILDWINRPLPPDGP